jgi:hypothetical protein
MLDPAASLEQTKAVTKKVKIFFEIRRYKPGTFACRFDILSGTTKNSSVQALSLLC